MFSQLARRRTSEKVKHERHRNLVWDLVIAHPPAVWPDTVTVTVNTVVSTSVQPLDDSISNLTRCRNLLQFGSRDCSVRYVASSERLKYMRLKNYHHTHEI